MTPSWYWTHWGTSSQWDSGATTSLGQTLTTRGAVTFNTCHTTCRSSLSGWALCRLYFSVGHSYFNASALCSAVLAPQTLNTGGHPHDLCSVLVRHILRHRSRVVWVVVTGWPSINCRASSFGHIIVCPVQCIALDESMPVCLSVRLSAIQFVHDSDRSFCPIFLKFGK